MENFEKQILENQTAWGKLSEDHYQTFKKLLSDPKTKLNPIVEEELGDIDGKRILHLQCNTGADSILMARKGAIVTGVDFVEDNIHFAKQLAKDFNIDNIQFVNSDVLKLIGKIDQLFDLIVTFDGVIGWLPDLHQWGKVIHHYLDKGGMFYLHDSHPFIMVFDEDGLDQGNLMVRYPYFSKEPDNDPFIGGYACEPKEAVNHYWNHTMDEIVMVLLNQGLKLSYIKEHEKCVVGMGGDTVDNDGLSFYKKHLGKLPMALSVKAIKE